MAYNLLKVLTNHNTYSSSQTYLKRSKEINSNFLDSLVNARVIVLNTLLNFEKNLVKSGQGEKWPLFSVQDLNNNTTYFEIGFKTDKFSE